MGWAGPAQPTGSDSTPKNYYPLLGQTRPRRLGWARASLAQQQTLAGGIISPPPLHAERYSFCMQRRKNKTQGGGGRKVTWRGEAVSGCVAGGAVAEVGGGVLAHGRRLQAAAAVLCFF